MTAPSFNRRNRSQGHLKLRKSPLGTHRFQRAVSAKGVLIWSRRSRIRRACVKWLSSAIARIRPQTLCGHQMGLPHTTARWKRCVPRAFRRG